MASKGLCCKVNHVNPGTIGSAAEIPLNKLFPDKGKSLGIWKNGKTRVLIAVAIFLVSYISFAGNGFGVASPEWFKIHQNDSEQLVLDGILYQSKSGSSEFFGLGTFSRPSVNEQHFKHVELYDNNNTEGNFSPYSSQFGLQVSVFSQAKKLGLSFNGMQNLTAGLLALLCSLSYLLLRHLDFPGLPSLAFSASFAFSPWVVVFARNLYWVPFTWFLPIIVGASICARRFNSKLKNFLVLGIGLYFPFLLKMLCGYEYITTIFASTLICSLISAFRCGAPKKDLTRIALVVSISFAIAFGSAAGLHVDQINRRGGDGIKTLLMTASKRASNSTMPIFAKLCAGTSDPSSCVKQNLGLPTSELSKSLQSSPIKVIGRYLAVKDSLPWSYFYSSTNIAAEIKETKSTGGAINMVNILAKSTPVEIAQFLAGLAFQLLNSVLLIGLALYCILFSRNKRQTTAIICLLAVAPLSWFVIAKGHSAIHYSINYVLWYVVLFPSMALIASNNFVGQAKLKHK